MVATYPEMDSMEIASDLDIHIRFAQVADIHSLASMPAERAFLLAGRQADLELYEHLKHELGVHNRESASFIKGLFEPYSNILGDTLLEPIDYLNSDRFKLAEEVTLNSISAGVDVFKLYSDEYLNGYLRFIMLNKLDISQLKNKYPVDIIKIPNDLISITNSDEKLCFRIMNIKDYSIDCSELRYLLTSGKFDKWEDFFNYVIDTGSYDKLFYHCYNEDREETLIDIIQCLIRNIIVDYVHHEEVINAIVTFSKLENNNILSLLASAPSWALEYYMDAFSLEEVLNEIILKDHPININVLLIFQKYISIFFNERAPTLLAKLLVSEPYEVDYLAGRLLRNLPNILPKTRVELIRLSLEDGLNFEEAVDISLIRINSIHLQELNIVSFD